MQSRNLKNWFTLKATQSNGQTHTLDVNIIGKKYVKQKQKNINEIYNKYWVITFIWT